MALDVPLGLQPHTTPNQSWVFSYPVDDNGGTLDEVWIGDLLVQGGDAGTVDRSATGGTAKVVGVSLSHVQQDATGAVRAAVSRDPLALWVIQVSDATAVLVEGDILQRHVVAYSGDPAATTDYSNMALDSAVDNTDGPLMVEAILSGPESTQGNYAALGADHVKCVVSIHADSRIGHP